MTDKDMDKDMYMELGADDELLVQSFFANARVEIPDDGFSDRVMASLPVERRVHWEYLWTAFCLFLGVAVFVLGNGWNHLRDWLFSFKIESLMGVARLSTLVDGSVGSIPAHLLTVLAGIVTLVVVWGYNEMMDVAGNQKGWR